ncbi:transcriptional regulator [Iodidimonas nitroreducens]|uniref:Transcriptional regulator n=1 Tax=Iodidimonas nitroreducens TaxID=1236968 RepID=A0A5A7N7F2_9PROT|nr:TetR/AcrR family transcriptional regulator [Iodidimonas nitroreducens]GAK34485.1 putative HTH-type transcriptional regulator YdeS [alpha proteobacterium Q-1]GER04028.1 transcriptional regulator [Iodidimonas nitroreducens]
MKQQPEKAKSDCLAVRGRPRSTDKHQAILDAAGDLFLEMGFDRAAMDQIAQRAGVSKQTVYSHFTNKEGLFRAVIKHRVTEFFPDDPVAGAAPRSLEDRLREIGRRYVTLVVSEDAVALFRLLAVNCESHPKLVEMFFEEGPGRLAAGIEKVLAHAAAQGAFTCEDRAEATRLFGTLMRGDLHLRRTLGIEPPLSASAIDDHVARAVRIFLDCYRHDES